jgi:hypothetical protein
VVPSILCESAKLASHTALRWPGDLWLKLADGVAMAGRLVVEVD